MTFLLITPPKVSDPNIETINQLFDLGLRTLLLRLKDAEDVDYENVIDQISPLYRDRILIDQYYHLLEKYVLQGVYVSYKKMDTLIKSPLKRHHTVVVGAHSLSELKRLVWHPTYAILSPVFDSISKEGYQANSSLIQEKENLQKLPFPVLALGGITPKNESLCFDLGFSGGAFIGDIWSNLGFEISAWNHWRMPEILSVAGHDPSGGAGITSDVLTAFSLGIRCRTIVSTLTIQSENVFRGALPIDSSTLQDNCEINLSQIRWAKIGMMPSLQEVEQIASELRKRGVRFIVWDPIVSASKSEVPGLDYKDVGLISRILSEIDLVTPNRNECSQLFGTTDRESLMEIARRTQCSFLLKGGHSSDSPTLSTDLLILPQAETYSFSVPRRGGEMHGTGCMLSTLILSWMAHGYSLLAACQKAQQRISRWMQNDQLLCNYKKSDVTYPKSMIQMLSSFQYITNTQDKKKLVERVRNVLQAGGKWIQLRLKEASTSLRVELAKELIPLCRAAHAILIIDDDVEAVLHSGADGIHLGKNDLSPIEARLILGDSAIIGYTCNTEEDILQAARFGVNYIGIGPYRNTETKKLLSPLLGIEGLQKLMEYNQKLPYPLPAVAIGGIDIADLMSIKKTGVVGVAVSGVIDKAPDPIATCRKFIDHIE